MFFNSLYFLIFFFITVALYYMVPHKARWSLLLFASVLFYMCWTPVHILILAAVALVSYIAGRYVYRADRSARKKKLCVAAGVILSFSVLLICKYAGFFTETLYSILDKLSISYQEVNLNIALPVGVSFFSFKAVSYIVDAYRGKIVEKNFLKYLLYISFFPQVASGPIERSTNLIPELSREHQFDRDNIRQALFLMLFGFFKKMVVADNLSVVVNQVFNEPSLYSPLVLVGIAFVYSIQILCDFSGYSDIAIGCAKMFGIGTAKNFDHPYFSTSIAKFWRNWHISLSSWFRDYLYIPLGGNRKGTLRKYVNLMVVFLVSGLWHGAAWNFVFWGFLHSVYQIFGALTAKIRGKAVSAIRLDRCRRLHKLVQITITFSLVTFAWIFFRADSISAGIDYVKCMFANAADGLNLSALIAQVKMIFSVKTVLFSFVFAFGAFAILALVDYKKGLYQTLERRGFVFKAMFYALFIVFILLFASTNAADFIYSRF